MININLNYWYLIAIKETILQWQIELFVLNSKAWNHLTMSKQMSSGLFKNVTNEVFADKSYMCAYNSGLALNPQGLIYHKTLLTQLV